MLCDVTPVFVQTQQPRDSEATLDFQCAGVISLEILKDMCARYVWLSRMYDNTCLHI